MTSRKNRPREGPFCGGKLRPPREGTCQHPPGWRTSHPGVGRCYFHGGASPSGVKAAAHEAAEAAVRRLGIPVRTTAEQALDDDLARGNGIVLWLTAKVASLPEEELAWGEQRRVAKTGGGGDGEETTVVLSTGRNVWYSMLLDERKHLAEVARWMLAANVSGRVVDLLEAFGAEVKFALDRALEGAGLAPEAQARVIALLPRELRAAGDDE